MICILRMLRYIEGRNDIVIGVDLGHPLKRSTGICVYSYDLDKYLVTTVIPVEVLSLCTILKGEVLNVAIDAPLSLPRRGVERDLERLCRKMNIRLLPPLLGPMRRLTVCGVSIREVLEKLNITVLETHPTSCLRLSKIRRDDLLKMFRDKIVNLSKLDKHCIDALICCLVGIAYNESRHVEIEAGDDRLILFDKDFVEWLRRGRL